MSKEYFFFEKEGRKSNRVSSNFSQVTLQVDHNLGLGGSYSFVFVYYLIHKYYACILTIVYAKLRS